MPPAAALLAPVGVALFWCLLLTGIGFLTGWRTLARCYPAGPHFDGTVFRNQSGQFRCGNYNRCLTVGVNAEGLRLAVFFLFRPGHPPIFVPWADVTAARYRGWLFHSFDFTFAKAPGVRLRLSDRLGREIARAACQSWADPEPDGS